MLKAKCWLGDVQEKDDRNRSKGVHPKCGPVAHERIVSLWISAPFNKVLRLSTVYTAAHNLFCVVDFGLETVTLVGQRHGSALRSKNPAEGSTGSVAKLSDGMSSSRRWGSSCREGCSVGASIGQSLCSKYAFSRFGWTGTLTGWFSNLRSLKWIGDNSNFFIAQSTQDMHKCLTYLNIPDQLYLRSNFSYSSCEFSNVRR